MINKINISLIVVVLLTIFNCTIEHNIISEKFFSNKSIVLKVVLKKQDSDNKFLYADLTVKNVSADTIRFTNAGILAIFSDDTSRAYKDDISSWIGDFSSINILAKDSLSFGIYFAFNEIIPESEIDKINISYHHPSSIIYK